MTSKKVIGGIGVLLISVLVAKYFSKKEGITIDTKTGSVKGIISVSREGREYYEWLGIPYAKPPVGPLRFASPQPIEKWDEVRDGSSYGNVCAQTDMFTGEIMGKEDCLFLNIHVPKIDDRKKLLPVLFFIHGGYFMTGSSNLYRPQYFMAEDVLVVTINYRLGALGFLSTGDAAVRGNMGLKDQSVALKWVSENIVNFGGDPKQITIFGESAGAASVHFQMLSPMSQGLAQRAISQSGSALSMWAINEDPIGQGQSFAKKVDCPVSSSVEMAKCLRNVDVYKFLEVHREVLVLTRTKDMFFVPTVETVVDDETFLADHPFNVVKLGKMAKIPLLLGFNKDEGLIFTQNVIKHPEFSKRMSNDWKMVDDVILFLLPYEKPKIDQIREFYFGKELPIQLVEPFSEVTKMLTDRWFSYGVYKAALAHAKHAPVKFYYYNKIGPSIFDFLILIKGEYHPMLEIVVGLVRNWFNTVILGNPHVSYGVCHADEMTMLFETPLTFYISTTDPNYEFSRDLIKSWVSFASASNVDDVEFRGEKFPSVQPNKELKALEISERPRIKISPIKERLQFWEAMDKQKI